MDLSSLSPSEDARPLHLLHPLTEEPLYADDEAQSGPFIVYVHGSDSKVFEKVKHRIANRRIGKVDAAKNKVRGLTAESVAGEDREMLVACIEGWEIVVNGEHAPSDKETIARILDSYPWIGEQVNAFIQDRANFLGE